MNKHKPNMDAEEFLRLAAASFSAHGFNAALRAKQETLNAYQ
jgi:hypothetical protein